MFRRFFWMNETCPDCGLHFDRGSGYWLGAMMFNMAFAIGVVILVLVLTAIATSPNPNWDLTIVLTIATAAIAPIVFFPFSRSLWVAAERAARLRDSTESE